MSELYDVAIVGGGPAGLAAAVVFGRSRKRVVLLDGGTPRNARAQYIGGFITQDRILPAAFRATAHEDIRAYPSTALHLNTLVKRIERGTSSSTNVPDLAPGSPAFTLHLDGTELVARRVLLATGVIDEPLPLEGSRDLWGRTLFQCPYCHGYEHRDKRLAFLAPSCDECNWSMLLRSWSRDVTVFTNSAYAMSDEHRAKLTEAGIRIVDERIVGLNRTGERLLAVRVEGEHEIACDALFFRPQQRHVAVVANMALAMTPDGFVRVDANFQTSMPGVYAAGDLATHYHGALAAASAGSQAAHCINHELTVQLVEEGLL
jgi:thioredoxin reductase